MTNRSTLMSEYDKAYTATLQDRIPSALNSPTTKNPTYVKKKDKQDISMRITRR